MAHLISAHQITWQFGTYAPWYKRVDDIKRAKWVVKSDVSPAAPISDQYPAQCSAQVVDSSAKIASIIEITCALAFVEIEAKWAGGSPQRKY